MDLNKPQRSVTYSIKLNDLNRDITRPEFQRIPDEGRVQQIKEDLLQEKKKYGSIEPMGVLIIGILNTRKYIIDGQHRLRAYLDLNEPEEIVIQEWTFLEMNEMRDHFMRINSYVPIEKYVLDPRSEEIKRSCDLLLNYVEKEYQMFISRSLNPNFPNIHLQTFRSIIHLLPEYNEFTSDNVINKFENYNLESKRKLLISRDRADRERAQKVDEIVRGKRLNKGLYINRSIKELQHLLVDN